MQIRWYVSHVASPSYLYLLGIQREDSLSKMGMQVPMLLKHYAVTYPPDSATAQRIFGDRVPNFKPWHFAVEERVPEARKKL